MAIDPDEPVLRQRAGNEMFGRIVAFPADDPFMVLVPWIDPRYQNVHIQKKRHARLHPLLFPKLVDEVIGDHSAVAG